MSKRRLLLISAPSEDDYSFQQQISALSGQECQLGNKIEIFWLSSAFTLSDQQLWFYLFKDLSVECNSKLN